MRLFVFSDLHCDGTATREVVRNANAADIAIGAGDFANARRGLGSCISILREIKRPTILVAGNSETTDELVDACRGWNEAHVLHGSSAVVNGITFAGLGGAVPVTPFGSWSYDFTESQAEALLDPIAICDVLVVHSPPKGFVDVSSRGQSLGSLAVRKAISRLRPRFVACGHIHQCAGQTADWDGTTILNAGPGGITWHY